METSEAAARSLRRHIWPVHRERRLTPQGKIATDRRAGTFKRDLPSTATVGREHVRSMATVTEVDRPRFSMNARGPARTVRDMPARRTPEDTQPKGPPHGITTKIAPRQKTHRRSKAVCLRAGNSAISARLKQAYSD